jgi:L-ascorbate metabolism protein UlaG (beta-lactamase superfamily)
MKMKIVVFIISAILLLFISPVNAQEAFEKDLIKTSTGDLAITFIGHGTLMIKYMGKTIHIDPFSRLTDYKNLPEADVIFLTHHHRDHLDEAALKHVQTKNTIVVLTKRCAEMTKNGGIVMNNGDVEVVSGIKVEAVPAYNLVHKKDNGQPYHPKGEGNGYVLTFGDKRVYIAGDTENTPEMKALERIDYAFLPMNLPYTMTPEMVVDAVTSFKPKVLYPYHYGKTDPSKLVSLLKDNKSIEVRIRSMM